QASTHRPGHREHPQGGRRADRPAHGGQVPRPTRSAVRSNAQAGMTSTIGAPMTSGSLAASRLRGEIDVSVLVPAKDEAENLPLFMALAAEAFAASPYNYEVVVIDDGSVDRTWAVLNELAEQYPFLHLERHRSRRGIADALHTGYLAARGSVLVFYPADL